MQGGSGDVGLNFGEGPTVAVSHEGALINDILLFQIK